MTIEVYRTADAPGSGLDYWRTLVEETLVPLHVGAVSPGAAPAYRGRMVSGSVGELGLCEMTAQPLLVDRSRSTIRRSDPGLLKVEVHTRGSSMLRQGDQETVLRPGTVAVVDTSRPYQMAAGFSAQQAPLPAAQLLTVMVPRDLVPGRWAAEDDALGGRLSTAGSLAAVAVDLFERIRYDDRSAAERLSAVFLELLSIGLAAAPEGRYDQVSARAHELLRWRIHRFIDQHLADPRLTPSVIARAHHISLRYLYRLFDEEGTSVAGFVRRRRLEACRRDLLDPAYRHRTAAAIGARWGFTSDAHFTRLFRAAYGSPPAAYRSGRLAVPRPRRGEGQ